MKTEKINGLTRITAGEGMRITKGDGEYLLAVDPAAGASEEGYYEVPEAEYQKHLTEEYAEINSI